MAGPKVGATPEAGGLATGAKHEHKTNPGLTLGKTPGAEGVGQAVKPPGQGGEGVLGAAQKVQAGNGGQTPGGHVGFGMTRPNSPGGSQQGAPAAAKPAGPAPEADPQASLPPAHRRKPGEDMDTYLKRLDATLKPPALPEEKSAGSKLVTAAKDSLDGARRWASNLLGGKTELKFKETSSLGHHQNATVDALNQAKKD